MFKLKINCEEKMRFIYNGRIINPDLTIIEAGLIDNSVIKVI